VRNATSGFHSIASQTPLSYENLGLPYDGIDSKVIDEPAVLQVKSYTPCYISLPSSHTPITPRILEPSLSTYHVQRREPPGPLILPDGFELGEYSRTKKNSKSQVEFMRLPVVFFGLSLSRSPTLSASHSLGIGTCETVYTF
jgi:hypothetical protein